MNMQRAAAGPVLIDSDDLPEYPLGPDDRLDSHWFMTWERRRWLNSDMRLNGSPECRALYFDLINIAYDQAPVGTLPANLDNLAKMVFADPGHFRSLCALEYGPLHRWHKCQCGDQVRLMHPTILDSLQEAIARRHDNRARCEAANVKKRLQRLRITIAGLHVELSKNDAAVRWIDEWLTENRCGYRGGRWIERAIRAWTRHLAELGGRR